MENEADRLRSVVAGLANVTGEMICPRCGKNGADHLIVLERTPFGLDASTRCPVEEGNVLQNATQTPAPAGLIPIWADGGDLICPRCGRSADVHLVRLEIFPRSGSAKCGLAPTIFCPIAGRGELSPPDPRARK